MDRKRKIIVIVLLILSMECFVVLKVYNEVTKYINNRHYIDKEDYDSVNKGIDFISKLPMQLLLNNKDFDEKKFLSNEEATQIIVAYYYKNNINIKTCHDDILNSDVKCLYISDINNHIIFNKDIKLLEKDFNFYNNNKVNVKYIKDKNVYYFNPDTSSVLIYNPYLVFKHYEVKNNNKVFSIGQGYIVNDKENKDIYHLVNYISGSNISSLKTNLKDYTKIINEFNVKQKDFVDTLDTFNYVLDKVDNTYYLKAFNK